ncbi:hypothetical protein DPX16_8063 [Anabarilius grahami]|uniref:Uncharacterized protein n=1 Tax=Anabarilius grahami TaxID=495550 RepID=A0A3N0XX01_ANAGA|nr:hypothetical protein DPX16_8063 [Anabarilius grahami]
MGIFKAKGLFCYGKSESKRNSPATGAIEKDAASLQNAAAPLSFLKLINQPLLPKESAASHQYFSSNSPPSLT